MARCGRSVCVCVCVYVHLNSVTPGSLKGCAEGLLKGGGGFGFELRDE